MSIPKEIVDQIDKILASGLPEGDIRRCYPEVVAWVAEHVSLVDLMRASGVELHPVSPDRPDVLVGSCPACHGPMMVEQ